MASYVGADVATHISLHTALHISVDITLNTALDIPLDVTPYICVDLQNPQLSIHETKSHKLINLFNFRHGLG